MLAALSERSTDPEIMDSFHGDITALKRVLDDINSVNRILGGNHITTQSVARLVQAHNKEQYTIIDVGCADGSMLRELARYARKRGLKITFIGIDLSAKALQLAENASVDFPEISYLQLDVLQLQASELQCDILITTLMTHHFTDANLTVLLAQFVRLAKIGVVINDLHRSRLAFYLFKLFSLLFITTDTARIDGLISIRKGFKKQDLIRFSRQLPQMQHSIQWKWAFRYVWIMEPNRPKNL
tara:strand:+ start:1255 stop:1980 length:726 start_codon:yes stop_codon:yes gene_type:complete